MEEFQPLIAFSDLKKTLIEHLIKENRLHPVIKYEDGFDALIINFGAPDADPVVYYLDDHIGLLFDENTLEIIGFQIEDFERHFVSNYENIRLVWQDTGETPQDVGDMMIAVEAKTLRVKRELAKTLEITQSVQDTQLLRALA